MKSKINQVQRDSKKYFLNDAKGFECLRFIDVQVILANFKENPTEKKTSTKS